jgi:hypothetical protein
MNVQDVWQAIHENESHTIVIFFHGESWQHEFPSSYVVRDLFAHVSQKTHSQYHELQFRQASSLWESKSLDPMIITWKYHNTLETKGQMIDLSQRYLPDLPIALLGYWVELENTERIRLKERHTMIWLKRITSTLIGLIKMPMNWDVL